MTDYLSEMFLSQLGMMDVEVWVEPFAGGLGAGLTMLNNKVVEEVWLCESNPALAALWQALIADPHEFAARIRATTPTVETFYAARERISEATHDTNDLMDVGLSAFIVNRCGYSGRVAPNVGPIGGRHQTGTYTVASRFHPDRLADRILALTPLTHRMRYLGADALSYLAELDGNVGLEDEIVAFADPPYFDEGERLYAGGMSLDQHLELARILNAAPFKWAATYDSTPMIATDWYPQRDILEYGWRHTANTHHLDTEYLILSDNLDIDGALMPSSLGGHWLDRTPERHPALLPPWAGQ